MENFIHISRRRRSIVEISTHHPEEFCRRTQLVAAIHPSVIISLKNCLYLVGVRGFPCCASDPPIFE
jgi:hypothetical protein